ncbi:MAG: plasmid mobilization relaxosome protein MobC [Oscillospiraceae bacterium]|nr:plasmid mobilization relaxosome protein MobC [Oscillospiraceae bacterium]
MRKRTISILFRLNEQENQIFRTQVALSGYSAQEYMRRRLIEDQVIKPRPAGEMAEIRRELSAIGNNVNQVARKVNSTGQVSVEDFQKVAQCLDNVWHLVKRL